MAVERRAAECQLHDALATLTTDYVEVRVRYHLGESGVTVPDTGWHPSATCPAAE